MILFLGHLICYMLADIFFMKGLSDVMAHIVMLFTCGKRQQITYPLFTYEVSRFLLPPHTKVIAMRQLAEKGK